MAYLLLLLYPVLSMFTPEPVQLRWWIRTGGVPMPDAISAQSIRNEANLLITKFVFIIIATCLAARWASIPLASVGFTLKQPTPVVAAGVVVCVFELFWASRMRHLSEQIRRDVADDSPLFLKQSPRKIFVTILVGGFAEELWRAVAILAFKHSAHSSTQAVMLTSVAFGIGHLQSPQSPAKALARIFRPTVAGVPLAVLFLWSNSLVVPFLVHVTLNSFAALMGRKKMVSRTP